MQTSPGSEFVYGLETWVLPFLDGLEGVAPARTRGLMKDYLIRLSKVGLGSVDGLDGRCQLDHLQRYGSGADPAIAIALCTGLRKTSSKREKNTPDTPLGRHVDPFQNGFHVCE